MENIEAHLKNKVIEEKPDIEGMLLPMAPNSDPDNRCVNSRVRGDALTLYFSASLHSTGKFYINLAFSKSSN